MPGAAPAVLAIIDRSIESLAQGIHHQRMEVDAYRLRPGAEPVPPRVRVRMVRVQRLGRPQALRLTLRCPTRCAIRVVGAVGQTGSFDTALMLTGARRHDLRIPYTSGGGSTVGHPLRRTRRVTVQIGIDTPHGELRQTRRLLIRP
jgi:hypothetical protein